MSNATRRWVFVVPSVGILLGCARSPETQGAAEPRPEPPAAAVASPEPASGMEPAAPQEPVAPTNELASPRDAGASDACPADMKLVEGDYCTKVEHSCLKSWYDQSNKKTVCEEFAPSAECAGERVKKRYCIDT
jgi:formylglycine-generating enzyme